MQSKYLALAALFFLPLLFVGKAAAKPPGDFLWADADYGAVCDGVANDTAALQAALTDVGAGGTLIFPPGATCRYDSELFLDNGADFVIEGNGATLKALDGMPLGGGYGGLRIHRSSSFEIRNLTLDGNRGSRGAGTPGLSDQLFLRGVSDVQLTHVRVIDSPHDGIHVKGFTPANGGEDRPVERLRLVGCSAEGSYRNGLTLTTVRDVQILGGGFTDTDGSLPMAGIDIETHDAEEFAETILIQGVTLSGNRGNGLQITEGGGGRTDNIRVLGNDFSNNVRGALRIRGSHLTIANNRFHDFHFEQGTTQDATVLIFSQANDVDLRGNAFDRIETGLDVVRVESGARRVHIAENSFGFINLLAAAGPAIYSFAPDVVISDNRFYNLGYRAIFVTGDRTVIDGNQVRCARRNAIWVNAEDTLLTHNQVGPLAVAGDGTAGQAVIRTRGSGGLVVGNTVACIDQTQRGIYIDAAPSLVTHNLVKGCDGAKWIQFQNGTPVPAGNVHETAAAAACVPVE